MWQDLSGVDPAELLRDGLATLRSRAEQTYKEVYREVTQGDWEREQQRQESIARMEAERNANGKAKRKAPEPLDLSILDNSLAGMKLLRWSGFQAELFSLWDLADRIAAHHNLERPPACPLNHSTQQTSFAIRDGYMTLIRWCDDRQAEQAKTSVKPSKKPRAKRRPTANQLKIQRRREFALKESAKGTSCPDIAAKWNAANKDDVLEATIRKDLSSRISIPPQV